MHCIRHYNNKRSKNKNSPYNNNIILAPTQAEK